MIKKSVYTIANALTLGKGIKRRIGDLEIRFPARWSRYYEADYEPETFRFCSQYVTSGAIVLDIGAHIGLFAVHFANLVGASGRVFSFEPTPFTRSVLKDVVRLNGVGETVEVRPEAVGNSVGTAEFFDTGDTVSNANSLVTSDRMVKSHTVPVTTVDEFVSERALEVKVIKVDVEGAEFDLLRGASNTLATHRPFVRLGLHPAAIANNGQSLEEIWDLLVGLKYSVVFEDSSIDRSWFCSQSNLFDVNLLPN